MFRALFIITHRHCLFFIYRYASSTGKAKPNYPKQVNEERNETNGRRGMKQMVDEEWTKRNLARGYENQAFDATNHVYLMFTTAEEINDGCSLVRDLTVWSCSVAWMRELIVRLDMN
jgi:hypothetical protein